MRRSSQQQCRRLQRRLAGHLGLCQRQAVQDGPCHSRLPASPAKMLRRNWTGQGLAAAPLTATALQGVLCITVPDAQVTQALTWVCGQNASEVVDGVHKSRVCRQGRGHQACHKMWALKSGLAI